MFCPGCGLSAERTVQYCRACGTDLGVVRDTLAQPDAAATSLAAAREQIAQALAARIQTGEWWHLGAMIPEVEKLFESRQDRELRLRRAEEGARLRRVRAGVITAAAGLGEIMLFAMLSIFKHDLLIMAGPGLVTFLIGLGIVLNGLLFTRKSQTYSSFAGGGPEGPSLLGGSTAPIVEPLPRPSFLPGSVTDQTTRNLTKE